MFLALLPYFAGILGVLIAVGLGTAWAEYGGRPRKLPEDGEARLESEPPDDGAEAAAEGEDDRPWEQPGAVRLDCEPDRGNTLLWLGRLSLWSIAGAALVGAVALLPVLPLAISVLVMAGRDRAKMDAGTMDPRGEGPTRRGARYARAALVVFALLVVALGALIGALIAFADS